MGSHIETLQNLKWDCPHHPVSGASTQVYGTNMLKGAGNGCIPCLIAFVSQVLGLAGVEAETLAAPKPPEDPLAKYTLLEGDTIPAAMTRKCKEIGNLIGGQCPPGVGFMLMLFEYNTKNKEYICSAKREDMIKVLREMADAFEKGDMGEQHPR